MGLITKIRARTNRSKQGALESSNSTGCTSKKMFPMKRSKCRTPSDSTDSDCTNDIKNSRESTKSLAFRVVSIPKEYTESNERFNWLTNELDSFEYKPSADTAKSVRRVSERSSPPRSIKEQAEVAPDNDCSLPFWLFPCWGYRITEKDVVTTRTSPRSTTPSDDGSASTWEPPDDKVGEVLEAKPVDDVSDITSVPSEDYSDEDDESSASESPNKEGDDSSLSSLDS
ncbi:hypothetical protein HJC23_007465 [Cyclotella cryptica]|uniref:Uncharacterized protein n=1 Tax=Cyclotella cryptica TaxID=29204 RepID=A0ABD3NWR9_9STRA|eukprot:CCRYP_020092-RA/>CCRYP_020092-RA protein AED:0.13 eAED:0.13 QI:282/1/1/1/0/0/2/406/227